MTEAYFKEMGYQRARQLRSGEWLGTQRMLYTTGLYLMGRDSWRTRFCYEHEADAVAAFDTWDGDGDPPGPWIKQKPQDRMNPKWLAAAKRELSDKEQ